MFPHWQKLVLAALLAGSYLTFQNCSKMSGRRPQNSDAKTKAEFGGNGYDGKVYVNTDPSKVCTDGSYVKGAIGIPTGTIGYYLIRTQCQDIKPQALSFGEVQVLSDTELSYKSEVFVDTHNPSPFDPHFSKVALLAHMNRGGPPHIVTDVKGHPFVESGHVDLSRDKGISAGESAKFEGRAGGYFSTPYSSDWNFGTGDFTIELWVNFSPFLAANTVSSFVSCYNRGAGSFSFTYNRVTQDIGWGTYQALALYSDNFRAHLSGTWEPVPGEWYHLAVVRSGNKLLFFINGKQSGASVTLTPNPMLFPTTNGEHTFGTQNTPLTIGAMSSIDGQPPNAYLDEIRITKGVARYTADFMIERQPFPDRE
jgi:hypothetical protein